ncbi:MAG: hypothetical protein E7178_01455 [Erysipelotrichaceae bacterium]|nr:hypothetical protein [Erysipelotrichaceae bacterium]
MSKKLLLTLLPLTFLVAACSGANRPAQSSSQPTGVSASSVSTPESSSVEPDPDPEPEPDPGQEGRTEPVGIGFEVKVGQYYYELVENLLPDEGRNASYTASDVSFETGDKVSVTLNGEAVEIWAEADKNHGVYPNYDERPQDSKYGEFTITEGAIGNIYFHVNSDDSYSIWITPNQEGGEGEEGGGEEGGGSEPVVNAYAIYAGDEKVCDLTMTGTKDYQQRDQAEAKGVSLTAGQQIALTNTGTGASWLCPIEGWSFGGNSESSEAWKAYLEVVTVGEAQVWEVKQDVTVDIYAKFAWGNDSIYFGIAAAE